MADDLDELLRRAMKSLDDQVPSGYFEGLPVRTLARLDGPPGDDMQTSGTKDGETSSGAPPREEDSGLHDIRNLAQSTKQRLSSQKIPTRTDDDVLASSSAGWKAVALPAPASAVSLPSVDELPSKKQIKKAYAEGSVATAVPAPEQATPIDTPIAKRPAAPKKGSARIFAITGGVLAAAAGAVIFIATRDSNKADSTAPAMSEGANATTAPAADKADFRSQEKTRTAEPRVEQAIATDTPGQGQVGGAANGSGAAPAPADAGIVELTKEPPAQQEPEKPTPPTKFAKPPAPVKSPGKATKSSGKKSKVEDIIDKPDSGKTAPPKPETKSVKPEAKDKTVPVTKGEKSGDPSFDDLLKEAGTDQKKAAKPTLEKKALNADDFKRGIGGVTGAASKCYQGQQGTAAVKIVIAPDGRVQKVTVTGVFAGTPVANCVSNAVKSATFPPWDGGPQSFNYSFLLSE
jgi:hypothetical protein